MVITLESPDYYYITIIILHHFPYKHEVLIVKP